MNMQHGWFSILMKICKNNFTFKQRGYLNNDNSKKDTFFYKALENICSSPLTNVGLGCEGVHQLCL